MSAPQLRRMQFLVGISPGRLLRLLLRHRFRVRQQNWRDLGQLVFISFLAGTCNVCDVIVARRGRTHSPVSPPIFIIGHWRSGTTLMHRLMAADPALHAPTFFECCLPRGFVSGAGFLKRRIEEHLPAERPFDDAPFGIDEPSEEEFVLAKEALVSPMLDAVFPRAAGYYRRHLHPAQLSLRERRSWEAALLDFARRLSAHHGKRLLFKSPAHSLRIAQLRRLFPGAKFVVLQRAPVDVLASTLKLETLLVEHNALQEPLAPVDTAWISERHGQLQTALKEAFDTLPAKDIAEVSYEALCRDSEAEIAGLYARLQLPDSADRQQALKAYLGSVPRLQSRSYHQVKSTPM